MPTQAQGSIANRMAGSLSYPDSGVVLYRRPLKENIERVQQAGAPTNYDARLNPRRLGFVTNKD